MWRVVVYRVDGKNTIVIKTEEFPSRNQAGAACRRFPKSYIYRDQATQTYWVKP